MATKLRTSLSGRSAALTLSVGLFATLLISPLGWTATESVPVDKTALESALRKVHPDYLAGIGSGLPPARYGVMSQDLNADGQPEYLVFLMGAYFCGTGGCLGQIFTHQGKALTSIGELPLARTPLWLGRERHHGWLDIWNRESGGGGTPTYVCYRYDGARYHAVHRQLQAPDNVRPLFANDLNYQQGEHFPSEPTSAK